VSVITARLFDPSIEFVSFPNKLLSFSNVLLPSWINPFVRYGISSLVYPVIVVAEGH